MTTGVEGELTLAAGRPFVQTNEAGLVFLQNSSKRQHKIVPIRAGETITSRLVSEYIRLKLSIVVEFCSNFEVSILA